MQSNVKNHKRSIAIKLIHGIDRTVDNIVLVILVLTLLTGGYFTWDTYRVFEAGSSAQYTQYKPPAEQDHVDPTFEELTRINKDVFGWLTVYDTGIDFPLVQGKDNIEYLNRDVMGKLSMAGSIFLDGDNSRKFKDFNSIIYGHHMVHSAMFGDIEKFSSEDFFNEHEYGNIFYNNKDHGIVFFAYIDSFTGYDRIYRAGIEDDGERSEYLTHILENAKYTRDVDVSISDQIVILSTCSITETDGRDILVGKITEETYKTLDKTTGEDEDSIWELLMRWISWVPRWVWPAILIYILGIVWWVRKRQGNARERKRNGEQDV